MELIIEFLKNAIKVWPSILLGALIPCGTLLVLLFSKVRKKVSFKAALYGFATFFASLAIVIALLLMFAQFFMPVITASQAASATSYIYIGGIIILLLFYLSSEALKQISFRSVIKTEKSEFAGLTFGSGFILAQNLLVIGLVYSGDIDMMQMLGFGLLMVICGIIYLLNAMIGYLLMREGNWLTGAAAAGSYFLILAMMLIFANVYVAYISIAVVLIFNLAIGYFLLPLPFKKKGNNNA